MVKLILYTDGASSGNPGPAGIGVVVYDSRKDVLREISEHIGHATNNVAEYRALIAGLVAALELGATSVLCYLDSELVVRQLNGSYKVREPTLRQLYGEVLKLAKTLEEFQVEQVPREKNVQADALATAAVRAAGKKKPASNMKEEPLSQSSDKINKLKDISDSASHSAGIQQTFNW